MTITMVSEHDLPNIVELIHETCKVSFKKFYPDAWINYTINRQTVNRLKEKMNLLHFYVIKDNNTIIGCGAIGDYYGKLNESCVFSFFIHPSFQGKGYGKALMTTLEQDEFFLRAEKIYVPSSIPAIPFYRKMGYDFVNNKLIHDNGSFLLVKQR